MSLQNVTELSCSKEPQQVVTEKNHSQKKSIAEITLLVISLLVCFVGLGFLIWGGIQSTTLLIVVGSALVVGGLLGIMIASLLIRLSKRKLQLLREQELLGQAERPLPRSFIIESLIQQVSEKERELKDQEKALQDLMSKYQQDIQKSSEPVTKYTTRINDLEKEKISLQQRLQESEISQSMTVKDALKQELEEKTGKCRVLQAKVQTGNKEQQALKDRCLKLEKQLQKLQQELHLKSQNIQVLEGEKQQLREELQKQEVKVSEGTRLEEAQQLLQESEDMLSSRRSEENCLNARIKLLLEEECISTRIRNARKRLAALTKKESPLLTLSQIQAKNDSLRAKEKELLQKEKELNQSEQKQVQAASSEESLVFEDAQESFEDKE